LNFGNPEKPEIMWQFRETVEGIAQACETFNIPVTGGNVSFYNETEGKPIHPTPVLGIVGIVKDISKTAKPGFKEEGNSIILLGENKEELGGSEYLRFIYNQEKGFPPQIDLDYEKRVQKLCIEAIEKGIIQSAHDISEGGLAVCIAECCFMNKPRIGCSIKLQNNIRSDALLFGETQSRIILSVKKNHIKSLCSLAEKKNIKTTLLGITGGNRIIIKYFENNVINVRVEEAFHSWKQAIPNIFRSTISDEYKLID
jgi:phosphoribosylformylglycinamidine synthase